MILPEFRPSALPLASEKITEWGVTLEFGEEVAHIKKFDHDIPFIKHAPFIDLFGMGPPEAFDRSKAPKCFWIQSDIVIEEERKAFEKG